MPSLLDDSTAPPMAAPEECAKLDNPLGAFFCEDIWNDDDLPPLMPPLAIMNPPAARIAQMIIFFIILTLWL